MYRQFLSESDGRGVLKSFDSRIEVLSAGSEPTEKVHPLAVEVMKEIGINIKSGNEPKNVSEFLDQDFDMVVTVCDNAKENCSFFSGKVKKRFHIGFEDPANFQGNYEEKLNKFRVIRDEIKKKFYELYKNEIIKKL